MIRYYLFLFFGLWIVFCPFTAMADQTMTLDQCLSYGYENNPTLKAADFQVAATQDNRKSLRADFLPSLSTSYGFNRVVNESSTGLTEEDYLDQFARNFSIQVSQVLFAGFRIRNTHDKAKIDVDRTRANRELARLELTYNIQRTFFELMKAKEDLTLAQEAIERLEQGVTSAQAYFDRQLISKAEVLFARVDLADAQQQASIARNEVNRKRIALFSLMNKPLDPATTFTGGLDFFNDTYPAEFDECWQLAKAGRPDIESLEKQVEMLLKDIDIAAGTYLPQIRLDLGYHDQNRDYDDPALSAAGPFERDQRNRYWSAGVTASWDLFDGGRSWYRRKRSINQVYQVQEQVKEIQLTIQEGIRKALFSIAEADDRAAATRVAVSAAKENYAMEERRLDAGLTTISMLLDAQSRLVRAQGNYIQAKLDYQMARAELDFMMGTR
ncbi:MAG: TolC family protein [Desulfotignum sp.]